MEQQKTDSVHLAAPSGQAVSRTTAATLLAGVLAAMGAAGLRSKATPRARKPVPTMVCSPPAEIAAWNAAVDARKKQRAVRRGDVLTKQERRAIIKVIGIRQHKKDQRANRAAHRGSPK